MKTVDRETPDLLLDALNAAERVQVSADDLQDRDHSGPLHGFVAHRIARVRITEVEIPGEGVVRQLALTQSLLYPVPAANDSRLVQ